MTALYDEMAVFATIADKGSFTATAAELGRSKAYVSQQMTRLEDTLGLQLLFRTTRKVSLTEAGQIYLEYCQQIVRSGLHANRAVAALKGDMSGLIKISVPTSFGELMVDEILSEFQDR